MLTKRLPVKLTDEELRLRGENLAAFEKQIGELEAEKKSSNDNFKSKIEACELEIERLVTQITERQELRDVQIEEIKDWDNQQVRTIRVDTQETVDVRPMTPNELSRPLPFGEERAAKKSK